MKKSEIINKLIELYSLRQIYYLNQIDNSKANEKIDNVSIFSEIFKLEKRVRELHQKVVACLLRKKSLQNY